jgi:hypothetical protein
MAKTSKGVKALGKKTQTGTMQHKEEDELEKNFMEEGEEIMPTVGKKKFPYTKAGKAAAKKAAVKTGKPVKKKKGY